MGLFYSFQSCRLTVLFDFHTLSTMPKNVNVSKNTAPKHIVKDSVISIDS